METDNFQFWQKMIEILEEGGMADHEKYPEIHFACKIFWETYDYKLLEKLLNETPWIIDEAKRNIAEEEKAKEENPLRPFPEGDELDNLKGQFNLGYVNHNGDMIGINPFSTTKGFLFSGAQGTGKTIPWLRLLDQILPLPIEDRGFNVIIIQGAKRDADGFIFKYPETFKIIEWDDLRYNIWQVDSWDTPIEKLRSSSTIFAGENFLYTLTLPILNFAVKRCFESNGVFEGSKNFPVFKEIDRKVNEFAGEFGIKGYEITNRIGKLRSRLIEFMDAGKTLNCRYGFPLEIFLENDICLNVKDVSEFLVRTTVMNILIDIQRHHEKYPLKESRLRTLVIIDEARWLFDIKRDKMDIPSNKIVERWFTTAREPGIGRIIITQEPQSVSRFVTDNCAFSLAFPVFGESLEAVKKLQNLTDKQASYLFKLAPYGEGIFRHPDFDRPFIVQIPSDLYLDKSVTREQTDRIMRPFIEDLHSKLEPEAEGKTIDLQEIWGRALKQVDGISILEMVKREPFMHYTRLRSTLKLSSEKFKLAIEWLEDKDLISVKKFRRSRKKFAQYLVLTDSAQKSLNLSKSKRISPSHFRHSLYCEYVKNWLQDNGYTAKREFSGDREEFGRIDVYSNQNGKEVAYEITLTLNSNDVMRNVNKCLYMFKIDKLVMVCDNKKDVDSVTRIISGNVEGCQLERIIFQTIGDFLEP
jgi:hypothetical protein